MNSTKNQYNGMKKYDTSEESDDFQCWLMELIRTNASFLNSFEINLHMTTSLKKILVPLDNSKNSFRGLSSAIYFCKKCVMQKIIALHSVLCSSKR